MARPGPATQAKRKRELAKQAKRKAKEERRALRKKQKALNSTQAVNPREDIDLDGIVTGPQKPSID
jgi:hypothetical protein